MSLTLAHYRCFYLHEHGRGDLSPFLRFCPPSHGLGFGGRYQPRGGGSGSVPHCTTVGPRPASVFPAVNRALGIVIQMGKTAARDQLGILSDAQAKMPTTCAA